MITFHTIRYKNILSFGNMMTEVQLDRSPFTLIQGKNGGGKSVLLDAICYALFGKPFRKINRPQLVNSKNGNDLLVEIEFSTHGKRYMIRRGMKPSVFEIYCDGELIDQNAMTKDYQEYLEQNILMFNFSTFTQIVILGKATYVSFMRLNTVQRREFIESILGLDIFGAMSEVHRARVSELKAKIDEIKSAITLSKEKIALRENYIKKLRQDDANKHEERVRRINEMLAVVKGEVEEVEQKISELAEKRVDVDDGLVEGIENKIRQLNALIAKSDIRVSQVDDEIDFFNKNDSCPTCGRPIDDALRASKLSELGTKQEDVQRASSELKEKCEAANDALRSLTEKVKQNNAISQKLAALTASKDEKLKQIVALESEKNEAATSDDSRIEKELDVLQAMMGMHEKLLDKRGDLIEKQEYYDVISGMLKDGGLKRMVIRNYIPLINKITNEHLKNLGFFVRFSVNEGFNEKILARGIDELSYHNFSEGEKLRIDLAMLMTWREIAKMQNNMSTNLLIFDEIFDSSMDQSGVDAFIEMLHGVKDGNVFVISHTPDKLSDKFQSNIVFGKEAGFSKILDNA